MPRVLWSTVSHRSAGRRRLAFWLLAALAAPGCGHEAKIDFTTVTKPPTVQVINPPVRTIVRVVGQPSFIESYERTSVFPKLTAYIEKWNVDIGDKVKKGQTRSPPCSCPSWSRISGRRRRRSSSISNGSSWPSRW